MRSSVSPELARLLEALYNLENAPPAERTHYARTFQDLVADVLSKTSSSESRCIHKNAQVPLPRLPTRAPQAAHDPTQGLNTRSLQQVGFGSRIV